MTNYEDGFAGNAQIADPMPAWVSQKEIREMERQQRQARATFSARRPSPFWQRKRDDAIARAEAR